MTNTRPKVEPDGIYNITEAARHLGVDRHTVSRYAASGILKFRVRKAGKRKVTTGAQILKCWEGMFI